jgi:hypothetical protein
MEIPTERHHLEYLGVDDTIILKRMLENSCGMDSGLVQELVAEFSIK